MRGFATAGVVLPQGASRELGAPFVPYLCPRQEEQSRRQAMERAGAQVEVKPMPVDVEEIELAPPPPATPVATPASTAPATARPGETPGALKVAPRDEYMAAFSDVEAPDFGIAPVGVDLQNARPEPEAPRVDLSQFSLAPVGSDMGEMPRAVDGPKPDISHLKLAD